MKNQKVNSLTPAGLKKLQEELALLKTKKIPAVIDRLSLARAEGDLSENSAYHGAKEQLEFLENRVSELEDILEQSNVVILAKGTHTVNVGSTVMVTVNGKKIVFYVVGEWEADPKSGKISASSPIGSALMNRRVGDKIEIAVPAGKVIYTITSIE
ncbi:MAG: transcription elongation factor GreA [Patescibacteria group bacterium]